MTGRETANLVLSENGVSKVEIHVISGHFSDHFDPRKNSIFLSKNVYSENSISAIGVAAHEAGHAVQNSKAYLPIKIRQSLVPITQIGSNLAMPLVMIGLLLPTQYNFVLNFGIILFSIAVIFQIVTLPVEFDASKRAIVALENLGSFSDEEIEGAKKVLKAAALTYIAAAFTSILSLIRLILLSRRRED